MSKPEPGRSIIPWLTRELRNRLAQLESERDAIRRALAELEDLPRSSRRAISADVVLEAVRMEPDVRATMLALELGVATEVVNRHLQNLQISGLVRQSRLGWCVSQSTLDAKLSQADQS
jgi:hypothetical protein